MPLCAVASLSTVSGLYWPESQTEISVTLPLKMELVTHHIDVSVDEPQLFHMGHFLLQEQVHLLFVLFQMLLLRLQSLKLNLQTRLDLLHLDRLVPVASGTDHRDKGHKQLSGIIPHRN